MSKIPPPQERWNEARAVWAADKKITYTDVAETLGVSKQAVAKRAKAEGWVKGENTAEIIRRAHEIADANAKSFNLPPSTFAERMAEGTTAAGVDTQIKGAPLPLSVPPGVDPALFDSATTLAAQKRAEILDRHRLETNALRGNLYEAIKRKDFGMGKVAKITAEAMQIIHVMERKAWGIEKDSGDSAPPVVIIERG